MGLEKAEKAIESLFDGVCSIFEFKDVLDGKVTKKERFLAAENVPCRMVYKSFAENEEEVNGEKIKFDVLLILPKGTDIKEGSEAEVKRNGEDFYFVMAGKCAKYMTHVEVKMKYGKRWA